jgi:short-subunit dehydrogenase
MVDFLEVTACDLLILNAGAGRYGRFTEVLIDDSTDLVELNVTAQMRLAHAWCRANTSGKIVFIASTASFLACPGMATYAASKAFILSFAEGLRFELRKTPLEVLTVCPGRFRSSFQERAALKSIPVEPSSREAAGLARKVARAIERKVGVYVPWPWNAMLMLKRLLPESFLMKLLEKTVLNRV